MSTPEITVMGAGIFGLSVAWSLVSRGARVAICDPAGVGTGASGGIVGALAPHVPENWNEKKQFQFESLELAGVLWTEIANVSGMDPGYGRTGRLQPVLAEKDLARAHARSETAAELWQGRYKWEVIANDGAPIASPTGYVIRDDLSARIHPRKAVAALAKALERRGVPFVEAPKGIEVWAKGATGLQELSEELGRPIGMGIKGQAALMSYDLGPCPQLFVDGLHIIPHADGTVAIGSSTEREFGDPFSTDAQLDPLIETARTAVPALRNAEVIERWAGLRPRAKSRAPMLGQHPTRTGVFIANGGFKIGFGMAPKVGEVMADLILDGRDLIPESFKVAACL